MVEMISPRRLVERVVDQAMQLIAGAEGVALTVDMEGPAGLAIRTRTVLWSNETGGMSPSSSQYRSADGATPVRHTTSPMAYDSSDILTSRALEVVDCPHDLRTRTA